MVFRGIGRSRFLFFSIPAGTQLCFQTTGVAVWHSYDGQKGRGGYKLGSTDSVYYWGTGF